MAACADRLFPHPRRAGSIGALTVAAFVLRRSVFPPLMARLLARRDLGLRLRDGRGRGGRGDDRRRANFFSRRVRYIGEIRAQRAKSRDPIGGYRPTVLAGPVLALGLRPRRRA
jgi:hypothetical protein